MIGKGREQTGESEKSRERERGEREKERLLYTVNCIIVLLSLLLLLLCHYLLLSQHSHYIFSHLSPLLSSSKPPQLYYIHERSVKEVCMSTDVFVFFFRRHPSHALLCSLFFLTWGCCFSAI